MTVICFVVVFNYDRLLEEVYQFWNLPVRHFGGTMGQRRRSRHRNALRPGVIPRVLIDRRSNERSKIVDSCISHGARGGNGASSSKE
jgi:hypothetical protein